MTGTHEQDERLPEALVSELKRIDRAPEVITSRVDRALAGMASAHFAPRRIPRWQRQRAWGVAASCVLAVALFATYRFSEQGDAPLYADIDGSGQIDIADVLALARPGQGVDQADLDAFAFHLVALDRDSTL